MGREKLFYPYVTPETLPLNRFLQRLHERSFRRSFLEDPEKVLAAGGLTEAQRKAALAQDMAELVKLGAHPILAVAIRTVLNRERNPENFEFFFDKTP